MFKIQRIKALQDSTSARNLANEFINEKGSCATLRQIHASCAKRRKNAPKRERDTSGFGYRFPLHWFRKWRQLYKPITN